MSKILVTYFSASGVTAKLTQNIADSIGTDLFELELVNPYSSSYNTVLDQAQRDMNANIRPEIRNKVYIKLAFKKWNIRKVKI